MERSQRTSECNVLSGFCAIGMHVRWLSLEFLNLRKTMNQNMYCGHPRASWWYAYIFSVSRLQRLQRGKRANQILLWDASQNPKLRHTKFLEEKRVMCGRSDLHIPKKQHSQIIIPSCGTSEFLSKKGFSLGDLICP